MSPCLPSATQQFLLDTRAPPFVEGQNQVRVCAYDYASDPTTANAGCADRVVLVDNPGGPGGPGGGGSTDPASASCAGKVTTAAGDAGPNTLVGTAGPDVIAGLEGDDVIRGLAGNDRLCGGPGKDTVAAGRGSDYVDIRNGEPGRANCGPGRDRVLADSSDQLKACELSDTRPVPGTFAARIDDLSCGRLAKLRMKKSKGYLKKAGAYAKAAGNSRALAGQARKAAADLKRAAARYTAAPVGKRGGRSATATAAGSGGSSALAAGKKAPPQAALNKQYAAAAKREKRASKAAARAMRKTDKKLNKMLKTRNELDDVDEEYEEDECPEPGKFAKQARKNRDKANKLKAAGDKARKGARRKSARATKERDKAFVMRDRGLLAPVNWPRYTQPDGCPEIMVDPDGGIRNVTDPFGIIFYGPSRSAGADSIARSMEAWVPGMRSDPNDGSRQAYRNNLGECIATETAADDNCGLCNRHHIRLGTIRSLAGIRSTFANGRYLATVGTPHFEQGSIECDGRPDHGIPDDGFTQNGREWFVDRILDDGLPWYADAIRSRESFRPQCGYRAQIDRIAYFIRTERP